LNEPVEAVLLLAALVEEGAPVDDAVMVLPNCVFEVTTTADVGDVDKVFTPVDAWLLLKAWVVELKEALALLLI